MAPVRPSYQSELYREFIGLDPESYRECVRFFEAREQEVRQLTLEEFFMVLAAYTDALFETGQYSKFLIRADELIALSMEQNLNDFQGRDVFIYTLYQKAYAYYYRMEFRSCQHVLTELIRIDPSDPRPQKLLRRCLLSQRPGYVQTARAVAILLFFLSAGVTAVELLFFRSFYPQWVAFTEMLRVGLFAAALLLLVLVSAFFQEQVRRRVHALVKHR